MYRAVGELHVHRIAWLHGTRRTQDAAVGVAGNGVAAREHRLRREVLQMGGERGKLLALLLQPDPGAAREAGGELVLAFARACDVRAAGEQAQFEAGRNMAGVLQALVHRIAQA